MDTVILYRGNATYFNSLCYFDKEEDDIYWLRFPSSKVGTPGSVGISNEGTDHSDTILKKARI